MSPKASKAASRPLPLLLEEPEARGAAAALGAAVAAAMAAAFPNGL